MSVLMEKYQENNELKKFILSDVKRTGVYLGKGSFGRVEEVKMAGTTFAGKIWHEILLDPENEGVENMITRFGKECELLSQVRHPNIVQFMGICFQQDSPYPMLVMERLHISLHKLLDSKQILPLGLKLSVLLDVTRGLVHLHNMRPPIVHRDLTTGNILLNKDSLKAKIADLGNARMIEPEKVSTTLSKNPGTLVYMPPEATGNHPIYNSKLDIFSFGHLSLHTITEVFPCDLLPATYHDPKTFALNARSELERRGVYMELLYSKIGRTHAMSSLIERCLDNIPQLRPSVLVLLNDIADLTKVYEDDLYMFRKGKLNIGAEYMHEEKENLHEQESSKTPSLIQSGVPELLEIYCPAAISLGRRKQWKQYVFQITETTLKYGKLKEEVRNQIDLKDITTVNARTSQDSANKFHFEIHFHGSGSPWHLRAHTKEKRESWIKALSSTSYSIPTSKTQTSSRNPTSETYEGEYYDVARTLRKLPPIPADTDDDDDIYESIDDRISPKKPETHTAADSKESSCPRSMCHNLPIIHDTEEEVYDEVLRPPSPLPSLPRRPSPPPSLPPSHPSPPPPSLPSPPPPSLPSPPPPSLPSSLLPSRSSQSNERSKPLQLCDDSTSEHDGELYMPLKSDESDADSNAYEFPNDPDENDSQLEDEDGYTWIDGSDQVSQLIEKSIAQCSSLGGQRTRSASVGNLVSQQSHSGDQNSLQLNILIQMHQMLAEMHATYQPVSFQQTQSTVHEIMEKAMKSESDKVEILRRSNDDEDDKLAEVSLDSDSKEEKVSKKNEGATLKVGMKKCLGELMDKTKNCSQTKIFDSYDTPETLEWTTASTTNMPFNPETLEGNALKILKSNIIDKKFIRNGHFGDIFKAKLVRGTSIVEIAIKTVKNFKNEKERTDFKKEHTAMSQLAHPNIVKFYGLICDEDIPSIVLEYLPYGDLKSFLQEHSRPIEKLLKYMLDVAMGMHYISCLGLVHRDLAARNIMLGKEEICKVGDFGFLREMTTTQENQQKAYIPQSSTPIPIRWMAPESLNPKQEIFTTASDVWSFGVVLWEIVNPTSVPYEDINDLNFIMSLVFMDVRLDLPKEYPSEIQSMMKACWRKDPTKRPNFLILSTTLSQHIDLTKEF